MIALLMSVIISSTSLLAQEYEPNPNIPISSSIVQDNLSQTSIKSKPPQPFVTQFGVCPALLCHRPHRASPRSLATRIVSSSSWPQSPFQPCS